MQPHSGFVENPSDGGAGGLAEHPERLLRGVTRISSNSARSPVALAAVSNVRS
jgi:hypothetical protein